MVIKIKGILKSDYSHEIIQYNEHFISDVDIIQWENGKWYNDWRSYGLGEIEEE